MVSRTVKRLLSGILVLIVYFTVFIPLAPQILSLIESFVSNYSHLFVVNIPITRFIHNEINNTITRIVEYRTIDLSVIIIFAAYFVVYVGAPFMIVLSLFRR